MEIPRACGIICALCPREPGDSDRLVCKWVGLLVLFNVLPSRGSSSSRALRTQCLEPPDYLCDPRFQHRFVLSVFGERKVTLVHGDQEGGSLAGIQVAPHQPSVLSFPECVRDGILPG